VIIDPACLAPIDPARRPAARQLVELDENDRGVLLVPPVSRASGGYSAAWAALLADRVIEGVRLIVPGDGAEVDRIARLVDSVERRGSLHLTGEHIALADLLAACDAALFLPPRSAPVDALAAAMLAGCPIVATAVGCVTELATDGEHVWICRPGQPRDAARRLIEILDGGPEVQRRREAGRRRAEAIFSRQMAVGSGP
jgi:glycosyltransferase involved in cell wall biosynthesis